MKASEDTLAVRSKYELDLFDVRGREPRWVQTLASADFPAGLDEFPWLLAIDGDWIVLGDVWANAGGVEKAGAVHVFRRVQGTWHHHDRLSAAIPAPKAYFGSSACVQGQTLTVGAQSTNGGQGSLHVFELRGDLWSEVQSFDGGAPKANLGVGVALYGDWMLAGASHSNDPSYGPGYVHFFHRELVSGEANWVHAQTFAGTNDVFPGSFGQVLALDGDYAVATTPGNSGGMSAETIVYRRMPGDVWVQSQLIHSPDKLLSGFTVSGFGNSLDLEGSDLVVSGPNLSDLGGPNGTAYHFRLADAHWDLLGRLVPTRAPRAGSAGTSVALAQGRAFVGSPSEDPTFGSFLGFPIILAAAGTVRVYELSRDAQQYCSCATGEPCANPDGHGGCANSTEAGGVLTSAGSGSLASDDLRVQAFDLPQYQVAVLAIGDKAVAMPFGDGRLCVWGDVVHVPAEITSGRGVVEWEPGLAGLAESLGDMIQPGESRHVQLFYRDPVGPCGSGINLTNAVRVAFGP